jgi:hypothetical protein
VVNPQLLWVPGPVQRIAEQDQAAHLLLRGDHAGHPTTEGMTTDDKVGRWISATRPGVAVDQVLIDRDGALRAAFRQGYRLGVHTALAQRSRPRPNSLDVARSAVRQVDPHGAGV